MNEQDILRVQYYGPKTFDEAKLVYTRFAMNAQRAMLAASKQEIDGYLGELGMWSHWLYESRILFELETRRLEAECPPMVVPLWCLFLIGG